MHFSTKKKVFDFHFGTTLVYNVHNCYCYIKNVPNVLRRICSNRNERKGKIVPSNMIYCFGISTSALGLATFKTQIRIHTQIRCRLNILPFGAFFSYIVIQASQKSLVGNYKRVHSMPFPVPVQPLCSNTHNFSYVLRLAKDDCATCTKA